MNITRISKISLLALTLAASAAPQLVPAANAQDKMAGSKMSDSKMSGDKMSGGKMAGDKMSGDKMADNKMAGGKMADHKMGAAMTSVKLTGGFKQITHATRGTATVVGNKVNLTNFATGAGPQLHVYLVPGKVTGNAAVKKLVAAKKFTDLGALKSIKGNQSYTLPKGAKAKGGSLVIWCDKFDVVFGAAALS